MADRRMFSKAIVMSDAFMDMSPLTRCLYFSLGMEADDDGVVSSPKGVMRRCGATKKNLDELIRNRYVLESPSKILVIKHWKMMNYIPKDRYKPSTYVEELDSLGFDEKGAYTELENSAYRSYTECIQNVYVGKDRLGKDKLSKVRVEEGNKSVFDMLEDL